MKRRDFLKTSLVATTAVAAAPLNAYSAKDTTMVRKYRDIGKTGLKMSDISYGTGRLPSPSMIVRAVDRGINYFDTAPDYGPSEKYIGQAMKNLKRDKIIIASKFCSAEPYPGHLELGSKKKDYIKAVEGSLSRMKTDYIDISFVHAIGEHSRSYESEKGRLLDEEMLGAAEELKKAGKIRFIAVSSHGPNNMESLLMTAVKSGHFDLIMPAFNFMNFPKLPAVMKEAKKRGIGVVAMKTLAGAKDTDFDPKGEPFAPAAFKWVLSHEEVSGLVVTIKNVSDLDLYLTASGKKFTKRDRTTLDRYALRYNEEYCRTGCNLCEASCPRGVEIAKTLRYRMYFSDYGMEKKAMESYASLKRDAAICSECKTVDCNGACPYGLTLRAVLTESDEMLSFNA